MTDWIFNLVRGFFGEHGYLTVFVALLLENAGIPVPGETILLFAAFLAFDEQELRLGYIILVAIAAATLGDNAGYLLGRRGGRKLLERYQHVFHIRQSFIDYGEQLFKKRGSVTIFLARFIFGMRIIAGPLAGVLKMPWRQFVIFNFLGATVWVTVISMVGYFFGENWEQLIKVMGRVNVLVFFLVLWVALMVWRRQRARKRLEASSPQRHRDTENG